MEHLERQNILEVKDLEIGFLHKKELQMVVKKISFQVDEGDILGIVGESGSGKSMTALAVANLLSREAIIKNGSIRFMGQELTSLNKEELRKLKGKDIGIIFQEPMTSLNPLLTIGKQVEEVLKIHSNYSKEERRRLVINMLQDVELKDVESLYHKYPHQLSGGMRQRVMIAMAMICSPKLLIADEPTTALDVTIQAQILDLIIKISKEKKTTVIFISHDLGVIKRICDKVLVMSKGSIVEEGGVVHLFDHPKEEYTKQLLHAVPSIKKSITRKQTVYENSSNTILEVKDLYVYYKKRRNALPLLRFLHKKKSDTVIINERYINVASNINNDSAIDSGDDDCINKYKYSDASDNNNEIKTTTLANDQKDGAIVKGVSFTMKEGEVVGIVGESGCGKTTLSKAIVGLNKDIKGEINRLEKNPQMVFQDPYQSLNPAKKVGWLLEEPLRLKGGYTKKERKQKVAEMLVKVGLGEEYQERYIKELSGGQRQRVSIACAIITNTKLIVLDEPVSALDVTIQAQILELLRSIKKEYNLSYLFISHDLNVIYEMCDRVLVMYQGKIIESAAINELYNNPKHNYTKKLLSVIPDL